MTDPLFTIRLEGDGANITYQIEGADEKDALRVWAKRHGSNSADLEVELIGSEVRDLPTLARNRLTVTPLEGLRNVWYFYGVLDETTVTGDIVLTV